MTTTAAVAAALAHGGATPVLAFMACVALATYAQNLTGFAFGLILLGLTASLQIASVADAANAAMVLTLVNAWSYFRASKQPPPWALMRPALATSVVGVAAGVVLLGWLGGNAIAWLRGLLGVSILGCAALLVLQGAPLVRVSGRRSFAVVGLLSGLLGGLFASSGPPLVYHLYRQPLPRELVRRGLLLAFACNAAVRLVLVLPTGQFSPRSLLLAACAVPVVHAVTRLHHRYPVAMRPGVLKALVAGLLCASGGTLLVSAWRAVAATGATG